MKTKTAQSPTQNLRNATQFEGMILEQRPDGKWAIVKDKYAGLDSIERQEREYLEKSFWQDILWAIGIVLSVVIRTILLVLGTVLYYGLVLIGQIFLSIGQLITGIVPSPGRTRRTPDPPMSGPVSRPTNIIINQTFNIK